MTTKINKVVADLQQLMQSNELSLGLAESVTGGLLSATLTTKSGASSWYLGGICAYSNIAKMKILNVLPEDIETYGAVSQEISTSLAVSVKQKLETTHAIALTGEAGPNISQRRYPVGTVFLTILSELELKEIRLNLTGSRVEIQEEAVLRSCLLLKELIENQI
ncbi:MAG: CinA family protein [Pseudomonadota bacterium]|nr:CinA family protein [Pseudomonadota bacterium]